MEHKEAYNSWRLKTLLCKAECLLFEMLCLTESLVPTVEKIVNSAMERVLVWNCSTLILTSKNRSQQTNSYSYALNGRLLC